MTLTPARVSRIFACCTTVRRALLASRRADRLGLVDLRDALFARAMELRAGTECPVAREHWEANRRAALERIAT
jgi:hypothetical protein